MGCVPFVVLSGIYHVRNIRGRAAIDKKLLENAGKVCVCVCVCVCVHVCVRACITVCLFITYS